MIWAALACAVVALLVGVVEFAAGRRGSGWFWCACAAALAGVAAVATTDWAGRLAEGGRDRLRAEDWYQDRRRLQAFLVVVIVVGGGLLALLLVRWLWRTRRTAVPMALAVIGWAGFLAVRTLSLHQVDSLLYRRHWAGHEVNAWFEVVLTGLVGLGCLIGIVSAWRAGRGTPATRSPGPSGSPAG